MADEGRTGAPSGSFARPPGAANKRDIQRGSGQAMTLSGVPGHIDHERAAGLGANGLPGWFGGFADSDGPRTAQVIKRR